MDHARGNGGVAVRRARSYRALLHALLVAAAFALGRTTTAAAQASPAERTFHQSKSQVEKAVKQLQPSMSGRLPTLEGFATATDHPLSRYQRGYYQASLQLDSTASGGTVVHVNATITAWCA